MRYITTLAFLALVPANLAHAADGQIADGATKSTDSGVLRAGASAIGAAPTRFPVIVNGGFLRSSATRLNDPIQAKCLVLDDGSTRLAIVVVDSCMMPRDLLDRAKELARVKTGMGADRILISATHSHSAPAAMGALGCPADADYVSMLPLKVAESIERAAQNLEPARVGWSVIDDHEHTFCRRWIHRPDKMLEDPFGQRTVRANMHPGYQNPDAIAPSGPADPALTVLSVQSRQGRPIAVLANYAMHYYGAEAVSADYFGRFAAALARRINAQAVDPPFVAMMSQGTSGDQMWMDYAKAKSDPGLDAYADAVARFAQEAYRSISYRDSVLLAMAETKLVLDRRFPDAARLAWARSVVAGMAGREIPNSLPEVYAKEALALNDEPRRELKLQAVRIGELGITAIPNEVFAITGLKIKAKSPFNATMNIELANGSEGYIPPPEQHALGGYTTWPARTAGLEVQAEPKIVAAVLGLLEQVAGKPRRGSSIAPCPYATTVLESKPRAYWRLDEIEGPTALDCTGNGRHARFDGNIAFYLPGPDAVGLFDGKSRDRAAYFAGGRLMADLDIVPAAYTAELWFWNGLPSDARGTTGDLLSIVRATTEKPTVLDLRLGGTRTAAGRLFFASGADVTTIATGKSAIEPKTWHHIVVVQNGQRLVAFLDGGQTPEIALDAVVEPARRKGWLCIGCRDDSSSRFEGKIDEVAFYDRVLSADEIAGHVRAAKESSRAGRGLSR